MKNTHELNSQIMEEKNKIDEKELKVINSDTQCGIGCFSPKWLQVFASKKAFLIVYALAGMQMHMMSAYYIGIMGTLEKNFNMSSRMSGIIASSWEIGGIVSNVTLTYIAAKGHRTRWIALGTFVVSISCLVRVLPYHLFGGGENIKLYTEEYAESFKNSTYQVENIVESTPNITFLHTNVNCDKSNTQASDMMAFYVFTIAQILMGAGTSVYWTCGSVYLDDNARKNVVPMLLAFVQAIKLFGPTIGFWLSSYVLKIFVNPSLTPTISSKDPRWIGAWWIGLLSVHVKNVGWYPIGMFGMVCASFMILFPKVLPRAALRKGSSIPKKSDPISLPDFAKSLKRIFKNKIVVFNSMSSVSFAIGLMALWTFMPKYMESQFRLTPSQSNFLTGTVSILSNALGIVTAGLVISKLRPPPRFLAGWNVFVEFCDVLGRFGYIMLSCPEQKFFGHSNEDNSWNMTDTCNENLNCGTDIQYAPVCDLSKDIAYYSSCHAGCTSSSLINGSMVYSNCSCVPGAQTVVEGTCPVDCSTNIILLIVLMTVLGFTSATGRSANTLIQFRCVDEKDKALSLGVSETLVALLAFMPSPILYGILMDWTCIVWGDNCGSRGNCWLYNSTKLRLVFNLTSAGFLMVGAILDCFVWYHVKGLKIYDEDFLGDSKPKKTANQVLAEKFEENERFKDAELSPMIAAHDK